MPLAENIFQLSTNNLPLEADADNHGNILFFCQEHGWLVANYSEEYLPEGEDFIGKSQDQLEDMVNRYGLLFNQEWTVITDDNDRDVDDYAPSGSRLFF